MQLVRILGPSPLERDAAGKMKSSIGTFFVKTRTLVTIAGIPHVMQQLKYRTILSEEESAMGHSLSERQWEEISDSAVDLIFRDGIVLIRPDPSRMDLAFEADELLQTVTPKHHIRYLHAQNPAVRQAIRARGENWRIAPRPCGTEKIIESIRQARSAIGNLPIYYYNASTGTRWLTCGEFASLEKEDDETLRAQLIELRDYSKKRNRMFFPEIAFLGASKQSAGIAALDAQPFETMDHFALRKSFHELYEKFLSDVPEVLRTDSFEDAEWRKALFTALEDDERGIETETLPEGMPAEYFRQVQWLPGGRIEQRALIFDPIFSYAQAHPEDEELKTLCDDRVKGFICNYIREFGNLLFANIGRMQLDLRKRPTVGGHRAYLVEIMCKGFDRPIARMIRIQRWGIREHLDEGHDLLWATTAATEYTQFTLNRRLGCWELGMPLPSWQGTNMIPEVYKGKQTSYHGTPIWTSYFERNHVPGIATDKISVEQLQDTAFADDLARLLGLAAAPNLVVGRLDSEGHVPFDSGDEILTLNESGRPERLIVADHTGTFQDVDSPLESFAEAYAQPVIARLNRLQDPERFQELYLQAFSHRLLILQSECPSRMHVFDAILSYAQRANGSFGDRWYKAIRRLSALDIPAFIQRVRLACEKAPAPTPIHQ